MSLVVRGWPACHQLAPTESTLMRSRATPLGAGQKAGGEKPILLISWTDARGRHDDTRLDDSADPPLVPASERDGVVAPRATSTHRGAPAPPTASVSMLSPASSVWEGVAFWSCSSKPSSSSRALFHLVPFVPQLPAIRDQAPSNLFHGHVTTHFGTMSG